MAELSAEDLRALGIDHASARTDTDLVEAVAILLSYGASIEDIAELGFAHTASARRIRPNPWLGDDADRALDEVGIDTEFSARLRVAMGLQAGTGLGLTEAELEATRFFASLRDILGDDGVLHIVRVIGSSSARIARATASMLRVNFQAPIDNSPAPLSTAIRAYASLIDASLPAFLDATATLVRRHLAAVIAAEQDWHVDESRSAAMQDRVVGFADLIGFTAFTEQADAAEFMQAMVRFESEVQDAVIDHGGIVVKLIGDEVMFVSTDADQGLQIARSLLSIGSHIAGLDGMRVGLSSGPVINSGGDYFGTTVNIAARIVGQAYPHAVVATRPVVEQLTTPTDLTPLGGHRLKGIRQTVELFRVRLD